jgi:hypothetical protein
MYVWEHLHTCDDVRVPGSGAYRTYRRFSSRLRGERILQFYCVLLYIIMDMCASALAAPAHAARYTATTSEDPRKSWNLHVVLATAVP